MELDEKRISTSKDSKWVKLNIGGQTFRTTRTTLSMDPNSMLARLCTSALPSETDEQGAILIDRDPTYFQPLLNYLRTGRMLLNQGMNPQAVLEEARFYNLQGAVEQLQKYELRDQTRYLIVTSDASSDYVMVEGPVEYSIMVELNGGQPPPLHLRKKLFPKVFGGGQSWNLALPLSQIFNSLASRSWRLVTSSAAAGNAAAPPAENGTQPLDRRYHIFIFVNTTDIAAEELTPRSGSASPRTTSRAAGGSAINPYAMPPANNNG